MLKGFRVGSATCSFPGFLGVICIMGARHINAKGIKLTFTETGSHSDNHRGAVGWAEKNLAMDDWPLTSRCLVAVTRSGWRGAL